jgi:predicted  nucleic acid-binding Zn ribbon protein
MHFRLLLFCLEHLSRIQAEATCGSVVQLLRFHDDTMILHKVIFGPIPLRKRQEAEDAVNSYISVLLHNGQVVGEYFQVMQNGELCAYVNLGGVKALSTKHQSDYASDRLNKVVAVFNQQPKWTLADDDAPQRDTTWNRAPFLYLFTSIMCDWGSPLCRGDNGKRIPLYRLAGQHEDREEIYFWKRAYCDHDAIWMACGKLEIPAYRQLALPDSELSERGRDVCRKVESTTGVPTYYFLMRYWGRKDGEDLRPCPGCGRPWRLEEPAGQSEKFCDFTFRCEKCRLVSHKADSYDDPRHASIGEWQGTGTRAKSSVTRARRAGI